MVKLGLNGRLISAKEIFDEAGIAGEEHYHQLIKSLKAPGILSDKLTQIQVTSLKSKHKGSRKAVPRYQIALPSVKPAKPVASDETDSSDYAKIYVSDLPFTATEEEIEKAFSQYGEVSDVAIPKDHFSGHSRGFAFVEFESKESVKKALGAKTPVVIQGRKAISSRIQKIEPSPALNSYRFFCRTSIVLKF